MPTALVLVAGGVNMDTTFRVARLPLAGETIAAVGRSEAIGGKGLNQALAIRRAGTPVEILGAVGDDSDGAAILEFLRREGVSCELLDVRQDAPTGRALILVDDNAENLIVVDPGSNLMMDPARVGELRNAWQVLRAVVANGETQQSVAVALFSEARKHAVTTVWNPSPVPEEPTALALTDTLIVNQREARCLAGQDGTPSELCRTLLGRGPSEVVVTLGAAGAVVGTQQELVTIPARAAEAVDPTAAGDTFLGYYVSSRLRGLTPEAAARVSNAAAALCVQRPGASCSIPHREAVAAAE